MISPTRQEPQKRDAMNQQIFNFLTSLTADQRQEHFDGKVRVYELCFPFADAGGTVHSQEFRTIRAANAAEARRTGRMIATNLGYEKNGWTGSVCVKAIG